MKRLSIAIFGALIALSLTGCVEDFASGPTARFVQLDNANRQYVKVDSTGKVEMVADSIYKRLVAGQPTVKVGINPRPRTYVAKDSLALVRPDAQIINSVIKTDPDRSSNLSIGIICLLLCPLLLIFIGQLNERGFFGLKGPRWLVFMIIVIPFYIGMNAIQRKPFDASHANEKQISMPTYRHYFEKDPRGVAFWDSVIAKGGFIVKIAD